MSVSHDTINFVHGKHSFEGSALHVGGPNDGCAPHVRITVKVPGENFQQVIFVNDESTLESYREALLDMVSQIDSIQAKLGERRLAPLVGA